jgi:hypothetical protein
MLSAYGTRGKHSQFCSFNTRSHVSSENVLLVTLGDILWVLEIQHFKKFFLFFSILVVCQCRQLAFGGVQAVSRTVRLKASHGFHGTRENSPFCQVPNVSV